MSVHFDKTDKYSCAIRYGGSDKQKFFKNRNLGRRSTKKYILSAFSECGNQGEGASEKMALHCLVKTAISRLFKAGHGNPAVALRSRHRDYRFFASYQNLRGSLGAKQQQNILNASSDRSSYSNDNVSSEQVADTAIVLQPVNLASSVFAGVCDGNFTVNLLYPSNAN